MFSEINYSNLDGLQLSLKAKDTIEIFQKKGVALVVYEDGTLLIDKEANPETELILELENELKIKGCAVNAIYVASHQFIQGEIQKVRVTSRDSSGLKAQDTAAKNDFMKLLRIALVNDCSDIHIRVCNPLTSVSFRRLGVAWEGANTVPTYDDAVKMVSRMLGVDGREQSSGDFDKVSIQHTSYTEECEANGKHYKCVVRVEKHPFAVRGDFKTVVRVNKIEKVKSLAELNVDHGFQEVSKSLMRKPKGLVLVVGPTGSGKTTLMHGMLKDYPQDKYLSTLEDPVEIFADYNPFISQHSYIESVGYANQLRSILRLDPDGILIGEIRDSETASIAVNAARTGHLTLSSLHCDSVQEVFPRLSGLGIDYNVQAQGEMLLSIAACKLVPFLCQEPKCREQAPLFSYKASSISGQNIQQRNPNGCEKCFNGISHRAPIVEYLELKEHHRNLVLNQDFVGLKNLLKQEGWLEMKDICLQLVKSGLVDPSDALVVPGFDVVYDSFLNSASLEEVNLNVI